MTNAELAMRLADRYVSRFLDEARLSKHRADEARHQLQIDLGSDRDGNRALRFSFPFVGSPIEIPSDGSPEAAERIVDFQATYKAEDVRWDQDNVGPTGWEATYDPEPEP